LEVQMSYLLKFPVQRNDVEFYFLTGTHYLKSATHFEY
jgi:hypothetical protein